MLNRSYWAFALRSDTTRMRHKMEDKIAEVIPPPSVLDIDILSSRVFSAHLFLAVLIDASLSKTKAFLQDGWTRTRKRSTKFHTPTFKRHFNSLVFDFVQIVSIRAPSGNPHKHIRTKPSLKSMKIPKNRNKNNFIEPPIITAPQIKLIIIKIAMVIFIFQILFITRTIKYE